MKDLVQFLKKTEGKLKIDVDGTFPQWFILSRIFNFLHLFPNAKIARSSSRTGYHLFAEVPSTIHMRRTLRDDLGRIFMTEKRQQMIGAGGDIIYREKGTFNVLKTKRGLIFKWNKRPRGDEPCDLRDVLRLPFKLTVDFHRRRRMRWWKRQLGIKKKERR
jgi:hypothetical protein